MNFVERPTLFMLIGIPGSGKSSHATTLLNIYENIQHLSSDAIRKELYGSEEIQGNPEEVFSLMKSRAINFLNDGVSVIYDATNISRKDRVSIISCCPKFVKIEAHVVWCPIEVCIERDLARNRTVGKNVIDKMVKRFQFPYYDEGIDEIKVFDTTLSDGKMSNRKKKKIVQSRINKITNDMKINQDNPHHQHTVFEHCINSAIYGVTHNYLPEVIESASLHDCGKPYVKSFVNTKGETTDVAHYYSHENVSAYIACGIVGNLESLWLISNHMEVYNKSKYYKNLPIYLKKLLDELHECDVHAH